MLLPAGLRQTPLARPLGKSWRPGIDPAGMYPACYSKAPKDHDLEGRYRRSLMNFPEVKSQLRWVHHLASGDHANNF